MIKEHIIYEDEWVIICHKPAGIATQTPVLGQQDLVNMLKNYRVQQGEEPYVGLVHRLDQPVEGVMVFAKTKEAASHLSKQVADRNFGKEYYAVVEGELANKEGQLTHWLVKDGKTNTGKIVSPKTNGAKQARLDYTVIGEQKEENGVRCLVHIRLHTGRHHQIRLQMAAIGHPIVGDRKYGMTEYKGYEPLSLCSVRVCFIHPKTGKEMDYRITPMGVQFQKFLNKNE